MNKATKGALAAVAGGTLMLGGAGSLAYWTGSGNVTGTNISSGELTLSAIDCTTGAEAHEWEFDNGDPFTGTELIVPGDTLSKECDATLTLTGEHVGATLGITTPTFSNSNALVTALAGTTATFTVEEAAYAPITAAGVYDIHVVVSVPFPTGADNTTRNLSTALQNVTVTATQTHDTTA